MKIQTLSLPIAPVTYAPTPDELATMTQEGWFLSSTDDSDHAPLELQRDDEAQKFDGDDSALTFVRAKALAGSEFHLAALLTAAKAEGYWCAENGIDRRNI